MAEVPNRYTDKSRVELQYGLASLGPHLSIEHELWSTKWHSVNGWFSNQLRVSQVRTYDEEAADMIFVATMMDFQNVGQQNDFIANAPEFLPQLGRKPHLVVLTHPPGIYKSNLLTHNNSQMFTFLKCGSVGPPTPPQESLHIITIPVLSHVHWSPGSYQLRLDGRESDFDVVAAQKTQLTVESFNVRHYKDRFAVYEGCKQEPKKCRHIDFKVAESAIEVFSAYQKAFYVLHPQGDFIVRNSWFDTFAAPAIPVLLHANYLDAMPFTDVIHYPDLLEYIPEENITGKHKQNIVQILDQNFDVAQALNKTRAIHKVRQVFQYALVHTPEALLWQDRAIIHRKEDAFTFSLKSAMRNACLRGWLTNRCM